MQMHKWCYLQTFSSIQSGSTTVPLGHPRSQSPGAAGKGWRGECCSAPTGKLSSNRNPPHFGRTAGLRRSQLPVLWTGRASPEHRNATIITVPRLKLKQFVMTNEEKSVSENHCFLFPPFPAPHKIWPRLSFSSILLSWKKHYHVCKALRWFLIYIIQMMAVLETALSAGITFWILIMHLNIQIEEKIRRTKTAAAWA